MDFQERYRKHKTFIENRWQPIDVKVILEEDPEMKISILKKAKQLAAKEIQDQEEQLSFLEYLDGELKWHEAELKQNDLISVSQSAQSNETRTAESVQNEKINWKGAQTQLAYLVQLLLENGFIEHGDHWKMCAEHFLVKGKPINNKKLAVAMGNIQEFNKGRKPKKGEILESIVSDISSPNN